MADLVSIIVPIYKVEDYLERCILSIINQTYKNLEIILVDDGSPDSCPKICDEYGKKDGRIKVIHKKNGGLSDARNAGLAIATGKWFFFVDSDDALVENAVEGLLACVTDDEVDVVIGTIKKEDNSGLLRVQTGKEAFWTIHRKYYWTAWGKLIKSELFQEHKFAVGKLYEDVGYTPYVVWFSRKVVIFDNGCYLYTVRDDSIMGKSKTVLSPDLVEMMEKTEEFIAGEDKKAHNFYMDFSMLHLFLQYQTVQNNMENETNQKFRREAARYISKLWKRIFFSQEFGIIAKFKIFLFGLCYRKK